MEDMSARLIFAIVVVIVGALVPLYIRRRERRLFGNEVYERQSLFSAGGKKSDSTKKKKCNPLAEADVYLAYGRKKQAIEILERALSEDPGRQEIQEKLNNLKG